MTETSQPKPAAAKRFYTDVTVEAADGVFSIHLDGRPIKTQSKDVLAITSATLADAIAGEWRAQGDTLDWSTLPLTAFASTTQDAGDTHHAQWVDRVLEYARTDLICYRADRPSSLVERQAAIWDPYVRWAQEVQGAELSVTTGLIAVDQTEAAIDALRVALQQMPLDRLLGVRVLTEVAGSAIIAMRLAAKDVSMADAFNAARLDEQYQREVWGEDAEALEKEKAIEADFENAARFVRLSEDAS